MIWGSIEYSREIGTCESILYDYQSLTVAVYSCAIFVFISILMGKMNLGEKTQRIISWVSDKTAVCIIKKIPLVKKIV